MSAPATATHDAVGHREPSKFHTFIALAMVLAVITGLEVVLVYTPWTPWIIIASLCVLSAFKFLCVIFIFMHLRWDKLFCTILFFIGLVLASGTMWALLHLFGADASKPLSSAALEFARAAQAGRV